MSRHPWLRGLLAFALLVALGYGFGWMLGTAGIDAAWIDARVRGQGLRGELLFLAVAALAVAFGAPRQSLCFLGGYAFGFALGGVLALTATLLGGLISFHYARLLAGEAIRERFAQHARRLDDVLMRYAFAAAVAIRLLPVGNNLVTNVAAGISRTRAAPFFFGSLIGYIPQTAVFALAGSGIGGDAVRRVGLGAVLWVVSGMIGVGLWARCCREAAPVTGVDGHPQLHRAIHETVP